MISLHQRIELLPKKYINIKEHFLAVKWLGNAGSHATETPSTDDVLDAYELMEFSLKEIHANPRQRVEAIAEKINRNKGLKKR